MLFASYQLLVLVHETGHSQETRLVCPRWSPSTVASTGGCLWRLADGIGHFKIQLRYGSYLVSNSSSGVNTS